MEAPLRRRSHRLRQAGSELSADVLLVPSPTSSSDLAEAAELEGWTTADDALLKEALRQDEARSADALAPLGSGEGLLLGARWRQFGRHKSCALPRVAPRTPPRVSDATRTLHARLPRR